MEFNCSKQSFERTLGVLRRLREAGYEAYIVGGAVRDAIIGRWTDVFDVACSAPPEAVESLFRRVITVGARFLVVKVLIAETEIEVATFRTEDSYTDGRRPGSVEPATLEEDTRRRDFTINGLYYDPFEDKLIDLVGGREDIERRVVRAIGEPENRFAEDHLRMLRAIRFAVTLDFEIEKRTFEGIKKLAKNIERVSKERTRDELLKILVCESRARGMRLLRESGLLEFILPEVLPMIGCPQPEQFHPEGDVWTHTLLCLEELNEPTPELALGTLLHDIGKPHTISYDDRIRFNNHDVIGAQLTARVCSRLRLSSEERDFVVSLVRNHMRFLNAEKMSVSKLKKLLRLERIQEHMELFRVDCVASHGDLSIYEFCRAKLEEFGEEQLRPAPLIRGNDLIAMGYKPGPIFGKILSRVEEAQLAGEVGTREQALELVRKEFGQPRAEPD